jgi:hypothetical protein
MDKRGSIELIILGLVAVIALIGLVMLFKGGTGQTAGQPLTKQVLPTEEEWRVERPLGWRCQCQTTCVYDGSVESAVSAITEQQPQAAAQCESILKSHCAPQPTAEIHMSCDHAVE